MRRFFSTVCLAAAFAALGGPAWADSYTLNFSSGPETDNPDGSFKQYKQSGFGVYHRYTNNFVYSGGALYSGYQEASVVNQTPDPSWNSATVYVGRLGYTDLTLDSFDIDGFGDKVYWKVYAYSSAPGTPLGTPIASGTDSIRGWTTIDLSSYNLPYEYQYGIQLEILSTDSGSHAKFGLDNIVVSPTPEPDSLMLLGTGLIAAGGLIVRRRQTA